MNIGKIIIGLIALAVAVWVFVSLEDATSKYLGGIILVIVGLVFLVMGFKKGKKEEPLKPQEPQSPPEQPEQKEQ